jgi:hypothetical protein
VDIYDVNKEHPNDSLKPKNGTNHTGKLKPNQIKSSSSLLSHGPQLHKRILVVDDNSDIVFTLRIGLERGKYAMAEYEKIKRITFPLKENHLLLVTTEVDADHGKIIRDILPRLT